MSFFLALYLIKFCYIYASSKLHVALWGQPLCWCGNEFDTPGLNYAAKNEGFDLNISLLDNVSQRQKPDAFLGGWLINVKTYNSDFILFLLFYLLFCLIWT